MLYLNETIPLLDFSLSYRNRNKATINLLNSVEYTSSVNNEGTCIASLLHDSFSVKAAYNIKKIGWFRLNYKLDYYHESKVSNYKADIQVLNFSFDRSFLKGRFGIGFSVNDILNKGQSFSYTMTSESVNKSYIPSYGRYFIVSVSYKFNKPNPNANYNTPGF